MSSSPKRFASAGEPRETVDRLRDKLAATARRVIPVIVAVAVLGALLLAVLWWMQERVAYQPQGPPYPDPGAVRRVDYRASDGQPLVAYVVGDPARAPGVVLAFHGNADLAAWQIPWGETVASRTGHAVFLAEYRGYMGLPGRPSYRGLKLDALAAHAFITDSLGAEAHRIAFFGHSLGAAVASDLALEHAPRALLLQSPFTSAQALVRRMATAAVAAIWPLLSRVPYDTRARVAQVDAPVWVIHGAHDELFPASMAREVFAAAKVKGGLVIVDDAAHNDLAAPGNTAYWNWVQSALATPADTASGASVPSARAGR